MDLNSIYLTNESGITSTSANFLANLAKEILKDAESQLSNICFLNKTAELINGDKKQIASGWTDPSQIEALIQKIGAMHSFIAWIREAIKAKDNLLSQIDRYDVSDYAEDNNLEIPSRPDQKFVSEATIINEMNIKERQRYFMLEAYAAAYGRYIHPDGSVAQARQDMYDRLNNPTKLAGNGRDLIIYGYTPSADKEDVETTYLSLQSQHREYEKQLNAIKFKVKEEVNRRNTEYLVEYRKALAEYNHEIELLRNAWSEQLIALKEQVSKMKIVIPNSLQSTYEQLEALVD